MPPHIPRHRLRQRSRLRIKLRCFLLRGVGLGSHSRSEEENARGEARRDKEQAQVEERAAVQRGDVADAREVRDEVSRQPGGEGAKNDDGVDPRGEEGGGGLNACVINDGAVSGSVFGGV